MMDNNRRMSDLSEMDYLAQTAISNNLMTQAAKGRAIQFPTVTAPSLEHDDDFEKSNISAPSDVGGPATKRIDNRGLQPDNYFHRMDEIESLAMTPMKDDDSNGEDAWMKSILARGDRTTDSNLNIN